MALYLCRLNPANLDKNGAPKFIGCLGVLNEDSDGIRFFPFVSGRKPSRKAHRSVSEAIPRWADERFQGFTRLMGKAEMEASREAAQ